MKFPLAIAPLLLSLAACAQSQFSPQLALSPDDRTVAFLQNETQDGSHTVALLNRSTGELSSATLPDRNQVNQLMWLDHRLYAGSQYLPKPAFQLLDSLHNTWSPAPMLHTIWYHPFIGTYNGQSALFLPETTTEIRSLADLSVIGKLDYPVRGVGDGYMLRYHWPAGGPMQLSSIGWMRQIGKTNDGTTYGSASIDSLELLDPQFHVVMTLTAAQAAAMRMPFTDGEAQISPDHKSLLLAPEPHGGTIFMGPSSIYPPSLYQWGFAVLDVATGKRLYPDLAAQLDTHAPGKPVLHSWFQTPIVLTDDGLYGVQGTKLVDDSDSPPHRENFQYWLVRYSFDGFQRIVQIDLPSESEQSFTTTASPSGGFILIHTLLPTPRILEVPLKPKVTAAEIRQFPLSKKS